MDPLWADIHLAKKLQSYKLVESNEYDSCVLTLK